MSTTAARATATEVVTALIRSIDGRDADAVAELITDDAAMADETSNGWARGKSQIHDLVQANFAAVESITSEVSDVVIRESADHATVTLVLTQSYVRDGEPVAIVAPTSLTLERVTGRWLISVMQASSRVGAEGFEPPTAGV